MFCPMCGAPNEDDSLYCQDCGADLGPEDKAGREAEAADAPMARGPEIVDDALEGVRASAVPGTKPESDPLESHEVVTEEERLDVRPASRAKSRPVPRSSRTATAQVAPTSGMAIASFVLGIGGLTVLPLLGSILAVLFGYLARSEIRQRRGELAGDGLALAGLIMGWIAVGAAVAVFILAALGVSLGLCCLGPCGFLSATAN
jgi:hypothetical protein